MPAAKCRSGAGGCCSCLIPTTIGALLSAIGIAGMDRLMQFNVLAMSGRAVEAAGDVDTLLLDKTGTITLGNRRRPSSSPRRACRATNWPTRRSCRVAAGRNAGGPLDRRAGQGEIRMRGRPRHGAEKARISFRSPRRRAVSGVDMEAVVDPQGRGRRDRRARQRRRCARELTQRSDRQARSPRPAARRWRGQGRQAARRHHLKDIVKGGIRERFAELRRWASAR
jgi:K+-transporting ATPase ATPase B chain